MGVQLDIDRTLLALADPHRRQVVDLLGERPRRAGELAGELQLPAPAMSRHLRMLREVGLVEQTHPPLDARVRIYSLRTGPLRELRAWLAHAERAWAEQLDAFKNHLEAQ